MFRFLYFASNIDYRQVDQDLRIQDYKEHLNIPEIKNFRLERFVGEHF